MPKVDELFYPWPFASWVRVIEAEVDAELADERAIAQADEPEDVLDGELNWRPK